MTGLEGPPLFGFQAGCAQEKLRRTNTLQYSKAAVWHACTEKRTHRLKVASACSQARPGSVHHRTRSLVEARLMHYIDVLSAGTQMGWPSDRRIAHGHISRHHRVPGRRSCRVKCFIHVSPHNPPPVTPAIGPHAVRSSVDGIRGWNSRQWFLL